MLFVVETTELESVTGPVGGDGSPNEKAPDLRQVLFVVETTELESVTSRV